MSPNNPPFFKRFLTSPRIVIYTVTILAVAFLMWMDERNRRKPQANPPAPTQPQAETQQSAPLPKPHPLRESELHAASSLPRLYIFIEEGEEPEWVQHLRSESQGKCHVLVVKGNNEEMKRFLKVESLPMIIRMDADGKEIARETPHLN